MISERLATIVSFLQKDRYRETVHSLHHQSKIRNRWFTIKLDAIACRTWNLVLNAFSPQRQKYSQLQGFPQFGRDLSVESE